jgi:type II secretion system (T2SS) protein E
LPLATQIRAPRFPGRNALRCQNPDCPHRHSLRRILRGQSEGIFLQGRWYCGLDCFEQAIISEFDGLLKLRDQPLSRIHRVPLGLLLLGRGVITNEQLKSALAAQRQSGAGRLGRLLVNSGAVTAQDISAALAAQWGCGIFPIESSKLYRDCSQLLPLALLESSRMIPVHYHDASQMMFVAFADDIDHTALYSVERQLGARTEPCVITESAMEEALEEIRAVSRPTEIVFETLWDPYEMARTVRDYSLALGADELFLARPRRFLWVRLRGGGRFHDLLFRLPTPPLDE